jgi:ATP-dependent DNA ligase
VPAGRLPDSSSPASPHPPNRPPSGPGWIHEIKHDGFRLMARRDAAGMRLLTRNGIDWTGRFLLIAEAAGALRGRSFLIDGEAVACDENGFAAVDAVWQTMLGSNEQILGVDGQILGRDQRD